MLTRIVIIPKAKAQAVASALLTACGYGVIGHYPAEAITVENTVWVRMPTESRDWTLSVIEARGLAGLIAVANGQAT